MPRKKFYKRVGSVVNNPPIAFVTDRDKAPQLNVNFRALSTINQTLKVEWGDGTESTYNLVSNIVFSIPQKVYTSPWGLGVNKTIRMTFQDNTKIKELYFFYLGMKDVPSNLQTLLNITRIEFENSGAGVVGNLMPGFPFALNNIRTITTLRFFKNFAVDSIYASKIPIEIFNNPLISFAYKEGLTTDWLNNNVDKIHLFASTLISLEIGNVNNKALFDSLPDDPVYGLQNLIKLETLSLDFAGFFGSPPSVINSIPSLRFLRLNGCVNSWGDLSNLTNLQQLILDSTDNGVNEKVEDVLPAWFHLLTKLKLVRLINCFNTVAKVNNIINSIYETTQVHSTIGSPGNMRSVNWNISGQPPSGIYQPPAGFRLNTTPFTITNISQTNPGVVTVSAIGNLTVGDIVYIKGIVGMTQVNEVLFKVANIVGNTFSLQTLAGADVDTTAYGAYVSGGTAHTDGNPASQREKLYVLVNNYSDIITYTS